jgi:hypothetical protein
MTSKQLQTLQTITNNDWVQWKTSKHIDGALAYNISQVGDSVMLQASNAQSIDWYQKAFSATMFIGVRGGVRNIKVNTF